MKNAQLQPVRHAVPALSMLCLITSASVGAAQASFEFGDADDGLQVTLDP